MSDFTSGMRKYAAERMYYGEHVTHEKLIQAADMIDKLEAEKDQQRIGLREKVWSIALRLTVEMEYARGIEKTKLKAKYEQLREVWDLLGGDLPPEKSEVAK